MDKIGIEKFFEVEMKVGKILTVSHIEKADRLYKLDVDLGEETPRQIVSGLRQHYSEEDLVGKQIIVVTNLEIVKLRGVESFGMLLATTNSEGRVILVRPEEDAQIGAKVG